MRNIGYPPFTYLLYTEQAGNRMAFKRPAKKPVLVHPEVRPFITMKYWGIRIL